jgi:carnitine O-acetyltransferase
MYRFERSLPHLPVPTLVETTAKWLDSVRPFVERPAADSADYQRVQKLADDFVSSPTVRKLQDRLKARAKDTDNWIADCRSARCSMH